MIQSEERKLPDIPKVSYFHVLFMNASLQYNDAPAMILFTITVSVRVFESCEAVVHS